eukprot:comp11769_c0_seq1/m.6369 comp11769_c0_seq1/g.6369  ORF comp11769_c0_seq1/g.6369 comp11769_c0_seq1/m.6369 type:complete len:524 (-) comp11769_c0_seq1:13-1584(-)
MNAMLFVLNIPRRIQYDTSTDKVDEYHDTIHKNKNGQSQGSADSHVQNVFDKAGVTSSASTREGSVAINIQSLSLVPEQSVEVVDQMSTELPSTDTKKEGGQPTLSESTHLIDVAEKLEEYLAKEKFKATWVAGAKGKSFIVQFVVPGHQVDDTLEDLMNIGIGSDYGAINVLPLELNKVPQDPDEDTTASDRFKESIGARITLEKAIASAKAGADVTFDYVMFVLCAATIAGVGLASNSLVSVVASMLVSPIMGPIMEFTFGAVIMDWPMIKHGLKIELMSLSICLVWGFLIGLIGAYPGYTYFNWPTSEMLGRCTWQNCVVGIFVAIPSGAGVALSILGSNVTGLVGVAISASLLPPAVNCGMMWAYAIVGPYLDDTLTGSELFQQGGWSFFLTVVNIICIFFSGIAIFKIKEIAPIPGKTEFWKTEVKAAREYNQNLNTPAANTLGAVPTKGGNGLGRTYPSQVTARPQLSRLATRYSQATNGGWDNVNAFRSRPVHTIREGTHTAEPAQKAVRRYTVVG